MTTINAPEIEYGIVLEHASQDVYEDLVGPTYESIPQATDELVSMGAHGFKGVVVSREVGTEQWLTMHTRETPIAYIQRIRWGVGK